MWRHLLAAAVVVVAGGLAEGQENKGPRPKRPTAAEQKEIQRKQTEAYLKKYPTEVPELAVLAEKADDTLAALIAGALKVSDDDKPAVRAAKRAMAAEVKRQELIHTRIAAGQY